MGVPMVIVVVAHASSSRSLSTPPQRPFASAGSRAFLRKVAPGLAPPSTRAEASSSGRQQRNFDDDFTIFQAALAEPVSFLGGVVAGFLSLEVDQDPLKTWIQMRAGEAGLAYQTALGKLRDQQKLSSKL